MNSNNQAVSGSYIDGFHQRQSQIYSTAKRLDLNPDSAIIFGSAGLALHNLDAYVKTPDSNNPFDVDAFITQTRLESIVDRYHRLPFLVKVGDIKDRVTVRRPLTRLPFTGFTGDLCDFGSYNSYRATQEDSVVLNGLATLPAPTLAMMKLKVGRRKDVAALFKAHLIGESQHNPIVEDPAWQEVIATAINRVQASSDIAEYGTTRYPLWLTNLVASQFDHKAFQSIPH